MKNLTPLKNQFGLTLLELLVTMAMVVILAAVAVPAFDQMIQNGRQSSELNNFLGALFTARSEAVKTGSRTVVCTSTDGSSCNNTVEWDSGWIVFIDENSNDSRDSSEQIIQIGSSMNAGQSLVGTTNVANLIRYQPNGDALESGSFTLCDGRGASDAEAIFLTAAGKPKVSDTGACGGVLSCP